MHILELRGFTIMSLNVIHIKEVTGSNAGMMCLVWICKLFRAKLFAKNGPDNNVQKDETELV